MWLTKIERIADWLSRNETQRQSYSTPCRVLKKRQRYSHSFADLGYYPHRLMLTGSTGRKIGE